MAPNWPLPVQSWRGRFADMSHWETSSCCWLEVSPRRIETLPGNKQKTRSTWAFDIKKCDTRYFTQRLYDLIWFLWFHSWSDRQKMCTAKSSISTFSIIQTSFYLFNSQSILTSIKSVTASSSTGIFRWTFPSLGTGRVSVVVSLLSKSEVLWVTSITAECSRSSELRGLPSYLETVSCVRKRWCACEHGNTKQKSAPQKNSLTIEEKCSGGFSVGGTWLKESWNVSIARWTAAAFCTLSPWRAQQRRVWRQSLHSNSSKRKNTCKLSHQ